MFHRVKRIMTHIPGAVWLKRKLFGNPPLVDPLRLIPVDLPENRGSVQAVDPEQLLNNYKESTVSNEPNRFVLYRIHTYTHSSTFPVCMCVYILLHTTK